MTVDILEYKIEINNEDYSRFVYDKSRLEISIMENSYPVASLILSNEGGFFKDKISEFENARVTIYGSLDAGETWHTLMEGTFDDIDIKMGPEEESYVNCIVHGGKTLLGARLGPNQIYSGNRNVKEMFVGTPTDSRGNKWESKDERGNHPNGILYMTGYGYSRDSVVSTIIEEEGYFSETMKDFPDEMILEGHNIFSVIKEVCNILGLSFWILDETSDILVYSLSAINDFPEYNEYALIYGDNINSVTDGFKFSKVYDKVSVVGIGTIFYQTKAREGTTGSKEFIEINDDIISYESAYLRAKLLHKINTNPYAQGEIKALPCTRNLIGKKIQIYHPDFNRISGNVVGMKQECSADRWTTVFVFENNRTNLGRTVAEIKDKMDNSDTIAQEGGCYLQVHNPNIYINTDRDIPFNPACLAAYELIEVDGEIREKIVEVAKISDYYLY